MKIEHIAVAANSEKESDSFFIDLLGMEKTRSFAVSDELMEQFFGVTEEHYLLRYKKDDLSVEVILTDDNSKVKDIFTHNCLLVDDPDALIGKASSMGFTTIKVPRKDAGYYYFVKDTNLNLYEIK
jgi:catechol 2,3-dioxygenase-like lactoylglutathione lyase family enzyme